MSLGTYLEDFGLRLSEGHDGRQGGGVNIVHLFIGRLTIYIATDFQHP